MWLHQTFCLSLQISSYAHTRCDALVCTQSEPCFGGVKEELKKEGIGAGFPDRLHQSVPRGRARWGRRMARRMARPGGAYGGRQRPRCGRSILFRCGVDGERGDMYAAEAGSALDSEQTGMRILGFSGYVRAKHVRSFPKVIFRNIPCVC